MDEPELPEILDKLRDAMGPLFSAGIANLPRDRASVILAAVLARTVSIRFSIELKAGEPFAVACYAVGESGLEELIWEIEGGPPQRFLWSRMPDSAATN
jgi:hypothetical protein